MSPIASRPDGHDVTFGSILFDRAEDRPGDDRALPAFFADLNLDQVVGAITRGRDSYRLEPFFATPLRPVESVIYRQEVFRDLQHAPLRGRIERFGKRMRAMREQLTQAQTLHYLRQGQRWFLDAADTYGQAVTSLAEDLHDADLGSRGLRDLRDWLADHLTREASKTLIADTQALLADLTDVEYAMTIKGDRVRVARYAGEADYGAEVLATFDKFRQGEVKDHRVQLPNSADMDHVEAAVLDLVANLYPRVFTALDDFCRDHADYLDTVVTDFDREVQFYLAYLEHIEFLTRSGMSFCYPQVSATSKQESAQDTFDLALAGKLTADGRPVAANTYTLTDPERIIVVTGPNQGGKTTFARTFGQLHQMAALGCPVPGRQARLFLCDQIFTHFEKQEDPGSLRGKLEDDLIRIRDILGRITPNSLLVMNEIFTSTALADALFLGEKVLAQVIAKDLLCVCVTFLDELASLGPSTVSMVAGVTDNDPPARTFKIERRPADGRAYAAAIAAQYRLTYPQLRERIRS